VLNHPAVMYTTVPPNPAFSGGSGWAPVVQSLLHFEDGNGSVVFTDNGTNPSTWTAIGNGAESTAQAKFGTGCIAYSPDYSGSSAGSGCHTPMTTGNNVDVFSGNGDFTIEFWAYPTGALGAVAYLCDFGYNQGYGLQIWSIGTQVSVYAGGTVFNDFNAVGTSFAYNTWSHVALVRNNDRLDLYVNGVWGNSATITGSFGSVPANTYATIGRPAQGAGGSTTLFYIDEFRITKGACLYGGPFSVPSASLTTTAAPTFTLAELLHFDDGNGSTAFTDSVGPQVWAAVGAAQESTAQFTFGSGSGEFVNAADYIKTSVTKGSSADITLGKQNFTFECFYYPNTVGAGTYVIADYTESASGSPGGTGFRLYSDGADCKVLCETSGTILTASGVFTSANVWYHMALVARGQSFYLYINGVLSANAVSGTRPVITTGARHFIGGQYGTNVAQGFIDEVRLVTGMAVYNANFTPPTAPYIGVTPLVIPLKEIHFASPFMGVLFVTAEFSVADPVVLAQYGSVFHYWIQSGSTWVASKDRMIGDIVVPSVLNGLEYVASRHGTPNPVWAPSVLHSVNDRVEPTVPNGFYFTAITTEGANPVSGATEPTWPTTDSATVTENSAVDSDQVASLVTAAPQPPTNVPGSTITTRYGNPAGGFGV
jgi:Concanavalin A-like lectin/glucanases superfamily